MSSTGRGTERAEADFYPTPPWCVDRLLERLQLAPGQWLEPSAGEGAIIWAVNAFYRRRAAELRASPELGKVGRDLLAAFERGVDWSAIELRQECLSSLLEAIKTGGTIGGGVRIQDFLRADLLDEAPWDVAIMNPPFSHALAFVERCLELVPRGYVCALERLNWMAGPRAKVFRRNMPDVYVLPDRPSFKGNGETDSIEYAWFVWGPGRGRLAGHVELLASTPREQRSERRGLRAPAQAGLFGGQG